MPFAPLVSKIRCHSPNRKGSVKANKNYLLYISTREGVDIGSLNEEKNLFNIEHEDILHKEADNELYLRYMAERPKSHGLMGNIDTSDLNKVASKVAELTSNGRNIYRGIISLSQKDAEALGFTNKEKWFDYLKNVMPDIAKELGLSVNYSWVFAFHGEKTHPHIHFQLWDNVDKVKSPFIHTSVQNKIRTLLSNAMFNEEYENMIKEVYKKEREELNQIRNKSRSELTNSAKEILNTLVTPGATKEKLTGRITIKDLKKLSKELQKLVDILPTKGSIDYAYLPPEVKKQVDNITSVMLDKNDLKKEFNAYIKAVEEGQKLLGKTSFEINIAKEKASEDIYKRIGNIIAKKAKECKEFKLNLEEELDKNIEKDLNTNENDGLQNDDVQDISDSINNESDRPNLQPDISNKYILEWSQNYKQALQYLYDPEKQDFKKAITLLKQEVARNNVLAIHDLGKVYEKGLGIETNIDIAKDYYKKALDGFLYLERLDNHKYIEYRIGKLYSSRKGTEKDIDKAISWFEKSANKEYKYAQYSLAKFYLKGISGKDKDLDNTTLQKKAISLLMKSADQGFSYAQYELGEIFDKGKIIEKDDNTAQKYYKLALDAFLNFLKDTNDDNISYKIGKMYYEGKGTEANQELAIYYLEKSAKLNNAQAQFLLAKIYLETGNTSKITEAIEWLNKASSNNNTAAMYMLGTIYMDDRYIKKDMDKALYYLNKAAENGNEFAHYQLGKIYLEGNGINKNTDIAIKHFLTASEFENDFAYYYLGKIFSNKDSSYYNLDDAIKWFKKAADRENDFAQFQLGKLYLFREKRDEKQGLYYLNKSAQNGNEYAKQTLEFYYNYQNNILNVMAYDLIKSFSNMLYYNKEQANVSLNDKRFRSKSKQARKEYKRKQQVPGKSYEL